jgi:hypothetical protein
MVGDAGMEMVDELNDAPSTKSRKNSDLALEISLSLYEDSQRGGGPRELASGLLFLGTSPVDAETIDTVQNMRRLNGRAEYPNETYLNKDFFLDDRTSAEIADNPLTRASMPAAAIGYLYDRFDQISNNGVITATSLDDYAKTRTDAGPLESAVLAYAQEHFRDLHSLGNDSFGFSPHGLRTAASELLDIRQGGRFDDEMKYLQDNFFALEQQRVSSGISLEDIGRQLAKSSSPSEIQTLSAIREHHRELTRFDTSDGGSSRNKYSRLPVTTYHNADGITGRDIVSWGAERGLRQRLGVVSPIDPNFRNYYETAKEYLKATRPTKSMADELFGR